MKQYKIIPQKKKATQYTYIYIYYDAKYMQNVKKEKRKKK